MTPVDRILHQFGYFRNLQIAVNSTKDCHRTWG